MANASWVAEVDCAYELTAMPRVWQSTFVISSLDVSVPESVFNGGYNADSESAHCFAVSDLPSTLMRPVGASMPPVWRYGGSTSGGMATNVVLELDVAMVILKGARVKVTMDGDTPEWGSMRQLCFV